MNNSDYKVVNITKGFILENYTFLKRCSDDLDWDDWKIENFLYELPQKFELSFVVDFLGEIVGYSIMSIKKPQTIHLHKFIVSPTFRRKRVGAFMWEQIIRTMVMGGVDFLTLKVHKNNSGAIRFYKKRNVKKYMNDGNLQIMRLSLK